MATTDKIQEAQARIDRVVEQMAQAKDDIDDAMRKHILNIIQASFLFSELGRKFVFSADSSLDQLVNEELIALSDEVLGIIEDRIRYVLTLVPDLQEQDQALSLEYIRRNIDGHDLIYRLDRYASDLKQQLEAYIAVGLNSGDTAVAILQDYMAYMEVPYQAPAIRQAFKERQDYAAPMILAMGYTYGKGKYISVAANFRRAERFAIAEAYGHANLLLWRRKGYATFTVYRGSSYPCDICDEMAGKTYPVDQQDILPAHPNCVCFGVPNNEDYEQQI